MWGHVSAESGPAWEGVVIDVSWSGVHLASPLAPDVADGGAVVRLYLDESRRGPSITLMGRMGRKTEDGWVIEIDQVDSADLHHLKNLIVHNASEPERAFGQIKRALLERFSN